MTSAADNGSGRTAGGKIRVAVLFGGQSDEHDVSLRSAQTVIAGLDPARYDVVEIGITRDGRWLTGGNPMAALKAESPLFALPEQTARVAPAASDSGVAGLPAELRSAIDVVFPVLHGPMGEDGTVQGMLELLGVPYVGSGVLGSAVAMDKPMTKIILQNAGIPQVEWMLVHRHQFQRQPEQVVAEVAERIGFPCFTKPANMGSSVGVAKVHRVEELGDALREAAAHDRRIVVERGIDARELEVSVLGNETPIASVAGEVVPCNEFYDYNAKYVDQGSELHIPAKIEPAMMSTLQQMACDAFLALDLAGMARADFFLERGTGQVYLNEVNTIPGFTSISMYPMLWAASGIPLPELLDRLVALSLQR